MRRARLWLEPLEDRLAPATFTVVNVADSGAGSLRQAIIASNGSPGANTIAFNIPGTGVHTINLVSALPDIVSMTTIAGNTQNGYTGNPLIQLNGSGAGTGANALVIRAGGSIVQGLIINHFAMNGIVIEASSTTVEGCFIGTDATGSVGAANGQAGVLLNAGATNNLIGTNGDGIADALERNVISGNGSDGVLISDTGTLGNVVAGDYIGLNAQGTGTVGNGQFGVAIVGAAASNRVGTDGVGNFATAERNVIAGNGYDGVLLEGAGVTNNVVAGNYIGTDYTGALALGGNHFGVKIDGGAAGNRVGTDGNGVGDAAERNVISGNQWDGVFIGGAGSNSNTVAGNYIGVDASGSKPLGDNYGVRIDQGAQHNVIGTNGSGIAANERNIISGNRNDGVYIVATGTSLNTIAGDYIGTDSTGLNAVPNTWQGIEIAGGASQNLIGGSVAAARNVISGNAIRGVLLTDSGTTGNKVQGNYIGVDATGLASLGNNWDGISINSGVSGNWIGTDGDGVADASEGNVISANHNNNIGLLGALNTHIAGNFIGTDATGTKALGPTYIGVWLGGGSQGNIIGTNGDGLSDTAERNVISGNGTSGVVITDAGSTGNIVAGDYIGTDVTGTASLGNGQFGVAVVSGAASNRIGTDGNGVGDVAEQNVISGNGWDGVYIAGTGSNHNVVAGNHIGVNANGTTALGNNFGVKIELGAQLNTIGVSTGGSGVQRNVISGNRNHGVFIVGIGTSSNVVTGNYIGTNAAGTAAIGNAWWGISVAAAGNQIGGSALAGLGNVVSGNFQGGITVLGKAAVGNLVQGNLVGTTANGASALGNAYSGVLVSDWGTAGDEPTNTLVGGNAAGLGNVVSANGNYGIWISGNGTTGTVVAGNYVGTDASGSAALPNAFSGVFINGGASNNRIGSDGNGVGDIAERNVISGNRQYGVLIQDQTTTLNVVAGNYIGTDANGQRAIGNQFGVLIWDSPGNRVGTNGTDIDASAEGNVISGNFYGVYLYDVSSVHNLIAGNFIGVGSSGAALRNNYGVILNNASNNMVGGNAALGNTIAYNPSAGVEAASGSGNSIRANAMYANGASGIVLVSGANNSQSYPTLTAAYTGAITRLTGSLKSTPNVTFTIDAYANASPDSSGYGEGQRYLGSFLVTTDGTGNASFNAAINAASSVGEWITATATDANGNTSPFSLAVQGVADLFINAAGGSWSVPSNWSLNAPPTSSQDAVVTPGSSVMVTHASGTDTVHTLISDGSLQISGGSVSVTGNIGGTVNVSGSGRLNLSGTGAIQGNVNINVSGGATVTLSGSLANTGNTLTVSGSGTLVLAGTLNGGTVSLSSGASLVGQGGTLNGVTVNGPLDLTANSSYLNVINGLTLNGTATLGAYARLYFNGGSQTLNGTGSVLFQNQAVNALVANASAMTLTIGPSITIHGGGNQSYSAQIGYSDYFGGGSNTSLLLQGTVSADTAGMAVTLKPAGTGTLTNTGTLSVGGGTLNLGGNYSTAGLGTVTYSSGVVNLTGTLNNIGTTLNLNTNTGSWDLSGGTINGGTISEAGGADLVLTPHGGILSGVTVNGPLDLTTLGADAEVLNGLTLNGTATFGPYAELDFGGGSQTLGGNGTVLFQGQFNDLTADANGMTLTIGPNITVHGAGTIGKGTNTSLLLQGTVVADAAGLTMALTPTGTGTLTNTGTLKVSGGTLVLGGNFTLAGLGTLTRSGGVVDITGTLNNTGRTLTLNATTGSWNLLGGTINGGIINESGGSGLALTSSTGTLNGVTINGPLDMTANTASAFVLNGLTLNGTATLGQYAALFFNGGSQTLGGNGTVLFQNQPGNALVANAEGMTLTIGHGITIHGGSSQSTFSAQIGYSGRYQGGYNTSVVIQGTISADTAGTAISLIPHGIGTLAVTGTISGQNGGTLYVYAPLTVAGQAIFSDSPSGAVQITGNLLATTTNVSQYNPQGVVYLSGSGTASSPQLLEAVSQNLGSIATAFNHNSAYGTLALSGNNYVKLVDQSDNAPGSPEAVYVNSLVVPAGSTLNLNGLHLYARAAQIAGTVTGGSITQVPNSGSFTINSPTAGQLSTAGELDDWTFFEHAGNVVTVALDPGSGAAGGPISPALQWAQVQLLDPSGNVLATGSSSAPGALVTLSQVHLPTDGTYTIAVQAAPGQATSTGNYVVAAYDVTSSIQPLNVNQTTRGTLATPYSIDQWTFSAAANTQVQFNLLAASATGVVFSLIGPGGYTGFANLSSSSTLLTLPASGTYTLTAQGTGGAMGSFAFDMAQTSVTPLSLGTPFGGTFAGSAQPQLFTVSLPSAAPLAIRVTDNTTADHVELYAGFGTAPTRQTYGYGANGAGSSQSLLVPSAAAGTWYVLVYGSSVASPPRSYTVEADSSSIVASAVAPASSSANTVASLALIGAGFTSDTKVALVSADGTAIYPASNVAVATFTQVTASVNLADVPQGTYSVRVSNAGGSNTLPGAFTVTPAGQAKLQTQLILPSAVGRHISSTFYVKYSNTGTAAMPAPVLLLESSVPTDQPFFTLNPALITPGFWTSALPQGYSHTVEILATGKVPGLLGPGESVTIPVYYAGMQLPWDLSEPQFHFDLRVFTIGDTDPVNWSSLQSVLQPPSISNAAWSTIYGNLTAQLGTTWGGYVQLLDNEAAYLAGIGEDVTDISQLWGFAVQQADNALSPVGPTLASATDDSVAIPGGLSLSFSRTFAGSIAGRDLFGPQGYGWSTPWQTTAATAPDGTVTITGAGGAQRIFQPDSRTAGAFFSQPGDTGTLKADGQGGYLLTEADGTATDYNAGGTLNYLRDTNGNRITANYTNGRLTSLVGSSGQSITIGYNSDGLIATVSDSQGRVITYSYDPTNQYLISVTGFNGQTTSYTYNTTGGSAAQNTLASITFPGSTHEYFTYDGEGRLAGTANDGGAQPQTFAYSAGQVSLTNGTGATSSVYYNEQGLVVKSIDALGSITLNTYDSNFNLLKVTNALGQSKRYTYNAAGEVTSSTDYLGNTTYFTYSGPFNKLASMTDANANTTNYAYSSAGDLLSTTYADGTSDSSTYNPLGEATSFLNANGQPIQYTYNAAGQVATETFSDGSQYAYTYDGHGNMLTATDAAGTTTFTYDPVTQLLTKVAYPSGMYLTFTYNPAGQRTQMVDQTGFTVNYGYDSVGRLSSLTDSNGNPIVTYTYDPDGRLSLKVNGNNTYTTYQYDADGNVLHLINYAPGGTINSRFDYTYNALGLETTEATLDGTWTYTYDADGQLIHAVFASTNPSGPSQDLAYTYDPMGNRVTTVINGVTTAYTTNNMNEYTSVGGVSYQYDADGNLLFDGTDTYSYSALNQLLSVAGASAETTYSYNALGQRVVSVTNDVAMQSLIDPVGMGDIVGLYAATGSLAADYTYGLDLASAVLPSGTDYYLGDAGENTVGVTNAIGALVANYEYTPFGQILSSTGQASNPFQFAGQLGVIQEKNGQDLMRARSYDPTRGRFDAPDPLRIASSYRSAYVYARNNPTTFSDPGGLSSSLSRALSVVGGVFKIVMGIGVIIETEGAEWKRAGSYIGHGINDIINGFRGSPEDQFQSQIQQALRQAAPSDPGLVNPPMQDCTFRMDPATPCATYGSDGMPNGMIFPMAPEAGPPWSGPGSSTDPTPMPAPPGGTAGDTGASGAPLSIDPNALIGPAGYGSLNFNGLDGALFPYQIDFENSPSATAPAQSVTITDELDPNLDWSTFRLTAIAWGGIVLQIPQGSQFYQSTVPMTYNGQTFEVEVEAGLHTDTGEVYATFQSIDPNTQLPPDVLSGFLPPEDGTGRGMGYISYMVEPKAGLPTGTQIRNVALVTFDQNLSIATDQVNDDDPTQGVDPNKQALITIDSGAPISSVALLPPVTVTPNFAVSWSGVDDLGGSGISSYTIYVSDDGGPFTPWLIDTTDTSDTYVGQAGRTYAFYSVATDNVGNVQAMPAGAQATTQVQGTTTTSLTSGHPAGSAYGQSVTFTAAVSADQSDAGTPTGSVQFQIDNVNSGGPVTLSGGTASFSTALLTAGSHTITAIYSSDNLAFAGSKNSVSAAVSPAMSVASTQSVKALQGISTGSVLLAIFDVQTGLALQPSNFGVTIDWKDGTALDGTNYALRLSGTQVQVYATHTYSASGAYAPALTLTYTGGYSIVGNPAIHVGSDVTGSVSMTKTAPTLYTGATNTALGLYHGDYRSTLTIKNTSSAAINGGLEILLSGLAANSPNVTLQYATVTVAGVLYNLTISYDSSGDPVVYIPQSIVRSLASGSSLSLSLWYYESAPSFVVYTPKLFSDPFDN